MQTEVEKYNGWTNYETWNCKLWIDNNQEDQEYWLEQARFLVSPEGQEAQKGRFGGTYDNLPHRLSVHALASQLEESFEDQAQEWMGDQASFFADIMNAGLNRVNWVEIAEHLIEEIG